MNGVAAWEKTKKFRQVLTSSAQPQIWSIHVVTELTQERRRRRSQQWV